MLIFNEGMVGSPVEPVEIQHEVQLDVPHLGGTNSFCQSQ